MEPFQTLGFIGNFGGWEIALLAMLGLLLFGKRLPDVAKNLGKGVTEFKKGLQGVTSEIDNAGQLPTPPAKQLEDRR